MNWISRFINLVLIATTFPIEDDSNHLKTTRKFYFVVPPSLYINNEFIPLNAIALESVISKWLGPRTNWDNVFNEISKKNYNMVHFTPLQERGESDSPYSIFIN